MRPAPPRWQNQPLVFHHLYTRVDTVSVAVGSETGIALPERLVIPRGTYRFAGKPYRLDTEGVYRFLDPPNGNLQRIVNDGGVDALVSSLAWIASHGNADNKLSNPEIQTRALTDKVFLTCGKVSRWALWNLDAAGVEARFVRALTLDEWNTYNNGHALIEIRDTAASRWVLYDLDNNHTFQSTDGQPLSLAGLVDRLRTNEYVLRQLASDGNLDVSGFEASNYDYHFVMEQINADVRRWYRRVLQVPLIEEDGSFYFPAGNQDDRVKSYKPGYVPLDPENWLSRFYPGAHDSAETRSHHVARIEISPSGKEFP